MSVLAAAEPDWWQLAITPATVAVMFLSGWVTLTKTRNEDVATWRERCEQERTDRLAAEERERKLLESMQEKLLPTLYDAVGIMRTFSAGGPR